MIYSFENIFTTYFYFGAVVHQGVRFDPDISQTLRLEFAKSNTKVTKPVNRQGVLLTGTPFQPREALSEYNIIVLIKKITVIAQKNFIITVRNHKSKRCNFV